MCQSNCAAPSRMYLYLHILLIHPGGSVRGYWMQYGTWVFTEHSRECCTYQARHALQESFRRAPIEVPQPFPVSYRGESRGNNIKERMREDCVLLTSWDVTLYCSTRSASGHKAYVMRVGSTCRLSKREWGVCVCLCMRRNYKYRNGVPKADASLWLWLAYAPEVVRFARWMIACWADVSTGCSTFSCSKRLRRMCTCRVSENVED